MYLVLFILSENFSLTSNKDNILNQISLQKFYCTSAAEGALVLKQSSLHSKGKAVGDVETPWSWNTDSKILHYIDLIQQ